MSVDLVQFDDKAEEAKNWLQNELDKIRSGRVSSSILNDVSVSVYGSQTPLEQLASIGNEGPRTLRIDVYDAGQIDAIQKAIQKADLGASIAKDDSGLRLNFPEMTEKNREEAMQRAKEKREEARVSLRKAREAMIRDIESAEDDGDISEDEQYRLKETLEEKMQETKDALDAMVEKKRESLSL
jgi:ribosome recycling factor